MFFHLCEVVQIFQRESIFCNKISSGGSLFIKKLVPGGTNFGGSIFTMTDTLRTDSSLRRITKNLPKFAREYGDILVCDYPLGTLKNYP